MYDIWNSKLVAVDEVYKKDNYRIVENMECANRVCYIFFSSNNIWFPNTEEAFKRSFINNDYYEWSNFTGLNAEKFIFVRDIYKSWYVSGINKQMDSIDKVADFLREQTRNMKVITVGSSAGGYMAALMAALLNAERCICFSAQFDLTLDDTVEKNPFLRKYKDEPNRSKYYDITKKIEGSKTSVFYIIPAYSKGDILQMKSVEKIPNVKILKISSHHHGVPVFTGNLGKLLTMDKEELESFFASKNEKISGMIKISVELCGVITTVKAMKYEMKKVYKKIVRR